jgi:hypothetical protein
MQMAMPAVEAFHAWHDFYVLIGTGAATLIGAMFVVASIGASFLTEQSEPQIRAFMTPTVLHLSAVLIGSGLTMVPSLDWLVLGLCIGAGGFAGFIYSGAAAVWIARREEVLLVDRLWYGLIPTIGYAVIVAAAVLVGLGAPRGIETFAVGLVLLLIVSIRNSWDLIVFYAQRTGGPGR